MKKLFIILPLLFVTETAVCKEMIIGDSHVGGIKWAVPKANVRFKNGSTSSYWKKQTPTYGLDKLYIMTGTNDYLNDVSPEAWYKNTETICKRWRPKKCYVVSPPPSYSPKYNLYRAYLRDKPDVRWITPNTGKLRDGVHYYRDTYKDFYYQIMYNY